VDAHLARLGRLHEVAVALAGGVNDHDFVDASGTERFEGFVEFHDRLPFCLSRLCGTIARVESDAG
jgi:hypothetical protein